MTVTFPGSISIYLNVCFPYFVCVSRFLFLFQFLGSGVLCECGTFKRCLPGLTLIFPGHLCMFWCSSSPPPSQKIKKYPIQLPLRPHIRRSRSYPRKVFATTGRISMKLHENCKYWRWMRIHLLIFFSLLFSLHTKLFPISWYTIHYCTPLGSIHDTIHYCTPLGSIHGVNRPSCLLC